ncbi:MAG: APC family permease [Clostridium perfringens]|nr:APC family permease [Clostridium perfringens]
MQENRYGLPTAIAMIIGIVIGSGIFFKSDNILIATNGSIGLGVLVFAIAALGIIFGSLSIAELASRNSEVGGVITYAEYSLNEGFACAFGWFHTFLYYPTIIAVVSWVTGIYGCMLFGVQESLEIQILIGTAIMTLIFLFNILSFKLSGWFQNAATVIKLIPLIIIAIVGLIFGNPEYITGEHIKIFAQTGWISAIAPIAFSFDGWIVSTSIGHEIKDSKKSLPKALVIAPIFILIIYILYFVGISSYVGVENVMALGDSHVNVAANSIFGAYGAKLILIFVIISIMGTVNGLTMGYIRMPYSLAVRNMFPRAKSISKISDKYKMPILSAVLVLGISLFWMIIHYITVKFNMLQNSDISEISITINYVLYIVFYIKVIRMGIKKEVKGIFKGFINPILAIVGSIIILLGSMRNNLFFVYAFICALVILSAIIFYKKAKIEV